MQSEYNFTAFPEAVIYGLAKFLGVPDLDIEDDSPSAIIEWAVEIEAKKDGIHCIATSIQKVHCVITWSTNTEDLATHDVQKLISRGGKVEGDNIEGQIIVGNTDNSWKVIDDDFICSTAGTLIPRRVEIDLQRKVIDVS